MSGPERAALGQRRLVRLLPVPIGLVVAAGVVSWWPFWPNSVVLGLVNTLVPASFVAIGLILRQDSTQRRTGTLMLLAAPCYLVSWWWEWPPFWLVGPLPIVSFLLGYFWFVCSGLALVRYPESRLAHRSDRLYFAVMAGWIGAFKVAIVAVSEPEWNRFPATAWWPTVFPDHPLHDHLRSTFSTGIAVIAVSLFAVLLRKARRSRGLDRIDSVPVVVAACAVTICGGAYFVVLLVPSPVLSDALRAATGVAALVTPVAFLIAVLRRGMARSSVADLVLRLGERPTLDGVQQAIRTALQDPDLVVLFWLPDTAAYVDAAGRAWDGGAAGRWRVPVESRDGRPLAVLLVDPALRRHPDLVKSTVVAGGLALENGRLHADIAAQLAEVRASRGRIVGSQIEERRRLERDLHDGAQQSLLSVTTALSHARLQAGTDPEVLVAIDRARVELARARRELRDLARGIHPAVLSQAGLGPAIESIVERLHLPATVVVPERRMPPVPETTCYFVVSETMTNVARHAEASSVSVRIHERDGLASVVVSDDGIGGVDPGRGSGLTGLKDRVRALGGTFTVVSPPDVGTTVSAEVPCA